MTTPFYRDPRNPDHVAPAIRRRAEKLYTDMGMALSAMDMFTQAALLKSLSNKDSFKTLPNRFQLLFAELVVGCEPEVTK